MLIHNESPRVGKRLVWITPFPWRPEVCELKIGRAAGGARLVWERHGLLVHTEHSGVQLAARSLLLLAQFRPAFPSNDTEERPLN